MTSKTDFRGVEDTSGSGKRGQPELSVMWECKANTSGYKPNEVLVLSGCPLHGKDLISILNVPKGRAFNKQNQLNVWAALGRNDNH